MWQAMREDVPIYVFAFFLYGTSPPMSGWRCRTRTRVCSSSEWCRVLGACGTIAIAYGVIGDIAIPAERASYVGTLMGFTNAAPSIGPVLGGVLAEQVGWRWIFWLLAILSGAFLVILVWFFPETCRRLVKDGSVAAVGLNRTLVSFCFGSRKLDGRDKQEARSIHVPNPLTSLQVLANKNSLVVILIGSVLYMTFGCLGASLSAQCIKVYSLNYLTGGLVYLPSGIGGILAAYMTGRRLDHDYAYTAGKLGVSANKRTGEDLKEFPIEHARLRTAWYLVAVAVGSTAGYGWSIQQRAHLAVPLVMQFLSGSSMVGMFTVNAHRPRCILRTDSKVETDLWFPIDRY
ncbi:major facilitator superfamily domain-containing protein [Xylariomycetidae sp. FL0641]|nr:major facilitator superfamily domain-containing protein [Xylariomycetidae sp. FL0641]